MKPLQDLKKQDRQIILGDFEIWPYLSSMLFVLNYKQQLIMCWAQPMYLSHNDPKLADVLDKLIVFYLKN